MDPPLEPPGSPPSLRKYGEVRGAPRLEDGPSSFFLHGYSREILLGPLGCYREIPCAGSPFDGIEALRRWFGRILYPARGRSASPAELRSPCITAAPPSRIRPVIPIFMGIAAPDNRSPERPRLPICFLPKRRRLTPTFDVSPP